MSKPNEYLSVGAIIIALAALTALSSLMVGAFMACTGLILIAQGFSQD